MDSFRSLDFGALGFVQNGKVILNRLPRKLETINAKKIITAVDLLTVYAGMNEKFFKYSVESGAEGLVVEALGVGNVPPAAFEGIKYVIDKNIPVVLVSRCPAGETFDIYGYPGAGKWLNRSDLRRLSQRAESKNKIDVSTWNNKRSEKVKEAF